MQEVIFIIWHSDWHSGGTWMSLKVVPQMSSKLSLKVFLAMAMINSLDTATGCCSICHQWWKIHR